MAWNGSPILSFDRVVLAVELVRERLLRSTAALNQAGIPYAVAGGHAVATWVSSVDPAGVRQTSDVDILVRRDDLPAIQATLAGVGFVFRHAAGIDMFLDGPAGKARDAVHLIFANEKVRAHEALPNPDVTDSQPGELFQYLTLPALVQIKLTAFRRKDQVHLDDMLEMGLIDATWAARYPAELAARLQSLIDTPGG